MTDISTSGDIADKDHKKPRVSVHGENYPSTPLTRDSTKKGGNHSGIWIGNLGEREVGHVNMTVGRVAPSSMVGVQSPVGGATVGNSDDGCLSVTSRVRPTFDSKTRSTAQSVTP